MEEASLSFVDQLTYFTERALGGGGDGHESAFGVHIKYDDLWFAMLYLAGIYAFGLLFERLLFCPALVGQIAAGIILGPELANIVPYTEAFVLLGEIGLVMLVIEAGVDIDVTTLKLIGKRGVIIATLGSIFPIAIGLGIAYALGADTKAAIAGGAAFGPTSLGIAMNILRTGKIINTPTGQLIVAAAIIDDMIALIILSQLGGLVGKITISGVVIPIVSALCFLVIGGYIALFILPGLLDRFILKESLSKSTHGKVALGIMLFLVLALMQATHYTKASHLMGAFIAGLVFCTDHELHVTFVQQFKRILQWLMRIFFASTIGFQVPVKQFGSGKVIWQGLLFTLALVGKLVVGFMVPNFTQEKNFTGTHLRDCLIVGCSMAAEGEFAFVIAAFAVDNGLIDKDLYSSVVLAILLSTIIAPFSLRFTIGYFNKRALAEVMMAEEEAGNANALSSFTDGILAGTTLFYCINTTSHAAWGTLPKLMQALFELELEVIDHRSWHSRFESTVINEVYVKGMVKKDMEETAQLQFIMQKVKDALQQDESIVSVARWVPGIVDEVLEKSLHGDDVEKDSRNIAELVAKEVEQKLNKSEHAGSQKEALLSKAEKGEVGKAEGGEAQKPRERRRRVRVTSTPIGGGDMFGGAPEIFQPTAPIPRQRRRVKTKSTPISGDMWGDGAAVMLAPGQILVDVIGANNEKYSAKMTEETFKLLSAGGTPITLEKAGDKTQFTAGILGGFVRRQSVLEE